MRIGIIAALPGELKPLVRGWQATKAADGTRKWTHLADDTTWIAVCSGMGAEAARRAFLEAESDGPLNMVLSVGWAGALVPDLQGGEVRVLSHILDAQTGEQFHLTQGECRLSLVTTPQVADQAEKSRLQAAYPRAIMIDMEAATVARLAQMRGIAVGCIKGVSDTLSARLPDLNPFISPRGQLRMLPFLSHIALRPKYWPSIAQLSKNSSSAAEAMADVILEFMKDHNLDRLNRTGHASA